MKSAASVANHPLHPMLIPLPIGLWLFSIFCDIMTLAQSGNLTWERCAFYTMAGGIVGALLAALPGLWDLYSMRPSPAKRIGIWHMSINLAIVALYVINLLWRRGGTFQTGQLVLSVVAVLLLCVSGWLGGEMVYVHGVAVARPEEPKRGGGS